MIYPEVSTVEWMKKTGLEPTEYNCPRCRAWYGVNVPIVTKDYYGFESEVHECGTRYTAIVVTARSPEKQKRWSEIFD